MISPSERRAQIRKLRLEKLDINNLPDVLLLDEVAHVFRVSPLTVKRWIRKGDIKAIQINKRGDYRIKRDVVQSKMSGK